MIKVKHKRQTLNDWQNDIHRFSFWYDGKEREAICIGALTVDFDGYLPDKVRTEVADAVYLAMDKKEETWSLPKGAKEIMDNYFKDEEELDRE